MSSLFRRTRSKTSVKDQTSSSPLREKETPPLPPPFPAPSSDGQSYAHTDELGRGRMGEGGKRRPDALTVPVSGNGIEKRFKGDGMRGRVISEPRAIHPSLSPTPTRPTFTNPPNSPPSPLHPNASSPNRALQSQAQSTTFLSTRFPLLSRSSVLPSAISSSTIPSSSSSSSWVAVGASAGGGERRRGTGYIGLETGLVLGLEDLMGFVRDCKGELILRGLKTPLLFSPSSITFSPTRLNSLITSFSSTLRPSSNQTSQPSTNPHPHPQLHPYPHPHNSHHSSAARPSPALQEYQEELKFAGVCEIAWALRWGLARVVRVEKEGMDGWGVGREGRGLLSWDRYEDWRGRERAGNYDPKSFETILLGLPPTLQTIVSELFNLLMHLTAHSTDSGLTPSILSSLFGPLLFGLGPSACPFETAHAAFVRASGATEHLLLAFIRWEQSNHSKLKGSFPRKLTEWIKGYPGMIISDRELDQGLPRRGVRVRKLEKIRRTVRAYSKDLISAGQEWPGEMNRYGGKRWEAWDSVLPQEHVRRKPGPRVSEGPRLPVLTEKHRKRMNLTADVVPLPSAISTSSSGFEKISLPGSMSNLSSSFSSELGTRAREPAGVDKEQKYGSLADKSWSEFEGFGFGEGVGKDRLEFNVYEGAKKEIMQAKRQTLSWADFASDQGGFERSNDALSKSLLFSPPVQEQIQQWPEEREELRKKLKKAYKEAIPFTWDTTPIVVDARGAVVEEMFLDAWVDLLYGGGWTDVEELTFRESNWVLMEYKVQSGASTRSDQEESKVFLFEETVPPAYQESLSLPKQKKSHGLFSRSKTTRHVPTQGNKGSPNRPSRDEVEFDAHVRKQDHTKQISLTKPMNGTIASQAMFQPTPTDDISPFKHKFFPRSESSKPSPGDHPVRALFRKRESHVSAIGKSGYPAEELEGIETRTTSGPSSADSAQSDPHAAGLEDYARLKPRKQESDKWIDILVANGATRMDIEPSHVSASNNPVLRSSLPSGTQSVSSSSQTSSVVLSNRTKSSSTLEDTSRPGSTPRLNPTVERADQVEPTYRRADDGPMNDRNSSAPLHPVILQRSPPTLGPVIPPSQPQAQPQFREDKPIRTLDEPEGRRDTVFSVISGYGHGNGTEEISPEVPPLPLPLLYARRSPGEGEEVLKDDVEEGDDERAERESCTHSEYSLPDSERYVVGEREKEIGCCSPPVPVRALPAEPGSPTLEEDGEEIEAVEPEEDYFGHHVNEKYHIHEQTSSLSPSDEYPFPLPPRIEDIEAIARQPSPGRVEHGIPLQSLQEEDEGEVEVIRSGRRR